MLKKRSISIGFIITALLIAGAVIVFLSGQEGSNEWREVQDRVLPQFMPVENKTQIPLVSKEFSEEVDIGFVIDAETKYQFIDPNMLETYGISEEQLYDTALDNLEAISKNISVEVAQASDEDETAKYVIVELDDGFAAARLLSAGVRRAIGRELGQEYIAAIPTRDFLIFWHRDFPLYDAFEKQVKVEFDAEEEYPLTAQSFLVNRYGIQAVEKVEE